MARGVLDVMRHWGLLPCLLLAMSACEPATDRQTEEGEPRRSAPVVPARSHDGSQTVANDSAPVPGPNLLIEETAKGETGARDLLLGFARAIELRKFDRAYAMLGPEVRADLSPVRFRTPLMDIGRLTVAIAGGRMEGAAGSLYYEVPIRLTGSEGGRRDGTVILRRVNDVDGAPPEQLRWHIYRFDLSAN